MQKLDEFLEKSKLNKTQVKTTSNLLLQMYKDETVTTCEYLMKLPLDVTNTFFTQNYSKIMQDDKLTDIITTLTSLEQFKKNTRDCAVLRSLVILNICFENENYSNVIEDLFISTLNLVSKNDIVKASFLNNINKKIISNTNLNFLKLNFKENNKFKVLLLIEQLLTTQILDVNSVEFTSLNIYNDYISNKDKLAQTIANSGKKNSNVLSLQAKIDEQNLTIERLTNEIDLLKKILEDEKQKTNNLVANLELSFGMN